MTKKHFLVALMLSPLFLAGCKGGNPGPEPTADEPLSITCVEGGEATIKYSVKGPKEKNLPKLQWSLDKKTWTDVTVETTGGEIKTIKQGETIYFQGNNPEGFNYYASSTDNIIFGFTSENDKTYSKKFKISGNIMSLLSKDYTKNKTIPCNGCFYGLFDGFGARTTGDQSTFGVVDASELLLPATELKEYAYAYMFANAKSRAALLTKAPKELPATVAAEHCYDSMFYNVLFMVTAPKINLETLAKSACYNMFNGCKSLKIYSNEGSEGRTKFFVCPDTSPDGCVGGMFAGTAGEFKEDPTAGNAYYYKA